MITPVEAPDFMEKIKYDEKTRKVILTFAPTKLSKAGRNAFKFVHKSVTSEIGYEVVVNIKCPCDASAAPKNGAKGNCSAALATGSTC